MALDIPRNKELAKTWQGTKMLTEDQNSVQGIVGKAMSAILRHKVRPKLH